VDAELPVVLAEGELAACGGDRGNGIAVVMTERQTPAGIVGCCRSRSSPDVATRRRCGHRRDRRHLRPPRRVGRCDAEGWRISPARRERMTHHPPKLPRSRRSVDRARRFEGHESTAAKYSNDPKFSCCGRFMDLRSGVLACCQRKRSGREDEALELRPPAAPVPRATTDR
jgi:hypothetical protein